MEESKRLYIAVKAFKDKFSVSTYGSLPFIKGIFQETQDEAFELAMGIQHAYSLLGVDFEIHNELDWSKMDTSHEMNFKCAMAYAKGMQMLYEQVGINTSGE